MCYLKRDVVEEMPEFALYNVVFTEHRDRSFTADSLYSELQRKGVSKIDRRELDRSIHRWLADERLYRSMYDYDTFEVAD